MRNTMKIPVLNSHYIKKWADETGKTYRELQALWKRTMGEVEYDRMLDPAKYANLKGDLSQEVQRRFEADLTGTQSTPEDQFVNAETEPIADEFGAETEENLAVGPEEIPVGEENFAGEQPEIGIDESIPMDVNAPIEETPIPEVPLTPQQSTPLSIDELFAEEESEPETIDDLFTEE